MQISPYNSSAYCLSYFPSFSAKSEEIKRADFIMRKTNQNFPMMSASYVDDLYECTRPKSKRREKSRKILRGLWDKVYFLREKCEYAEKYAAYSSFEKKSMFDLEQISKVKIGNCEESAKAAMAVLCANGYYNSSRVSLCYKVEFVNKQTKKVEYFAINSLDHSCVTTDLNTRKEQDIVIDPWFGFADFKQGAVSRFKQVYLDKTEHFKTMQQKLFAEQKAKKGEKFNPNDYEMRTKFLFNRLYSDFSSKEEKEKLGELVLEQYPKTALNIKA